MPHRIGRRPSPRPPGTTGMVAPVREPNVFEPLPIHRSAPSRHCRPLPPSFEIPWKASEPRHPVSQAECDPTRCRLPVDLDNRRAPTGRHQNRRQKPQLPRGPQRAPYRPRRLNRLPAVTRLTPRTPSLAWRLARWLPTPRIAPPLPRGERAGVRGEGRRVGSTPTSPHRAQHTSGAAKRQQMRTSPNRPTKTTPTGRTQTIQAPRKRLNPKRSSDS